MGNIYLAICIIVYSTIIFANIGFLAASLYPKEFKIANSVKIIVIAIEIFILIALLVATWMNMP